MELIVALLLAKKENTTKDISTIILGLHDYTSTCSTNNYDTIPHHSWLSFSQESTIEHDLFIIFIILISYNITFNLFDPNRIDCRVLRLHKNKISKK